MTDATITLAERAARLKRGIRVLPFLSPQMLVLLLEDADILKESAAITAALSERKSFEKWYVEHVFDYARDPLGSALCGQQWAAWKARAALASEASRG